MKIREYSGPLTVLGAGVLGFSLICIVSAAALANPQTPSASNIGAQEIVDSAFSNPISTAAALTAVEISEYIPTPTPTFTASITPSLTAITYITPTRPFVTWTPAPPTRTRMPRWTATATSSRIPSRTPSRTPTKTLVPSPTDTRVPTLTFTPQPTDTDTPIPPNTPHPTETNTPEPPPPPPSTNTPIDTETPVPAGITPP